MYQYAEPSARIRCRTCQPNNLNRAYTSSISLLFTLLTFLLFTSFTAIAADEEEGLIKPGDAVVTGFSGIMPPSIPTPPDTNPLDYFFIDTLGPAVQVLSLSGLGDAPNQQLTTPAIKKQISAGDVGQVFAIAMDDGFDNESPNIYLGATSAYGLQIIAPSESGETLPKRLTKGQPGAQWMAGQFGPLSTGAAGAIWRIDGTTGQISLFASLQQNSGQGIGDIVFDTNSRHFFVSDLDTGLIHRLDSSGRLVDSFDHGTDGRPTKGLASVADDGLAIDIQTPAFDTQNPETWGYTQPERRVYGMTLHNGRLYYAVVDGLQIWSIGLNSDGSFNADPRWELNVEGTEGKGPITDMLFDNKGRLYLAQRGQAKGSYDYSEVIEPGKSTVLRYSKEQPDNPATESAWMSDHESYAIGQLAPHNNATGGITIGFSHDETGNLLFDSADRMLWSTGERLRTSNDDPAAEADVHGLQGNGIDLVRPANEPPQQSYFADYDSLFHDHGKAGHMGDIEIWQGKGEIAQSSDELPPGYIPLDIIPPEDLPIGDNPGFDLNLSLSKHATPIKCVDAGANWRCSYRVRVRNTSDNQSYFGIIRVNDHLVDAPAGTIVSVPQSPAPWTCWWVSAPNNFSCQRHAFLAPHAGVSFQVHARIPKTYPSCHFTNIAEISRPITGSWRNINPTDDVDTATALIPANHCQPNNKKANLSIKKAADPEKCFSFGNSYHCRFKVSVQNTGPGTFKHQLTLQDSATAGTTTTFGAGWNCAANGGGHSCTRNANPLTLLPGQKTFLWAWVHVPKDVAKDNNCKITNKVKITTPAPGHAMNTQAGDNHAAATAKIPGNLCNQFIPWKCPPGFNLVNGQCLPIVIPKKCPVGTFGTWPDCKKIDIKPKCPVGTIGAWPNCKVVDITPKCPAGTFGTWPNCKNIVIKPCPAGTTGIWPNCKPIVIDPKCPQGTFGTWPNCKPLIINKCPAGTIGTWPDCKSIVIKPCPAGTFGTWPNCKPVLIKKCPAGTVGTWPNCKSVIIKKCPPGTTGTWPNCKNVIIKKCPPGTTGTWPNCKNVIIKKCPPGTTGTWPNCKNVIIKKCPPGTTGTWPNCKNVIIKKCPPGTTGTWPNCKNVIIKKCPPGTTGTWPNCKNVIIKKCPRGTTGTWPNCKNVVVRKCPRGSVGTWPNCKNMVIKKCAPGTVGTWPNCRRINIQTKCPSGTTGRWPNCVKIDRIRQPVKPINPQVKPLQPVIKEVPNLKFQQLEFK